MKRYIRCRIDTDTDILDFAGEDVWVKVTCMGGRMQGCDYYIRILKTTPDVLYNRILSFEVDDVSNREQSTPDFKEYILNNICREQIQDFICLFKMEYPVEVISTEELMELI